MFFRIRLSTSNMEESLYSHEQNRKKIKLQPILTRGALITIVILLLAGCKFNELPGASRVTPTNNSHAASAPVGLPNIGNSCYMNAALQIFANLYPDAFEGKEGRIAEVGRNMIEAIKGNDKKDVRAAAVAFREAIQAPEGLNWHVGNNQQDAHELMIELFEKLNLSEAARCAHQYRIFTGRGTQRKRWNAVEPFSEMLLTVNMEKRPMQVLWDNNFCPASIEQEDGSVVTAQEQILLADLENLPNGILPILAGRFSPEAKNITLVKLPFHVTIRKEHQHNGTQRKPYRLVAFIHHRGNTPHSGHYVAYVRKGEQWFCCDDSRVSAVSNKSAESVAERAYLYYYQPSLACSLD